MMIRNLPENVQIEIFSRLPVKSLLRFMCVSKSWYRLFKSTAFITRHLQLEHATNLDHKKRCLVIDFKVPRKYFSTLYNETLDILVDLEFPKFGYRRFLPHSVSNSCNGIICLRGGVLFKGRRVRPNETNLFVMLNPATLEFKCLPLTPPPVSYPNYVETDTYDFALGFDSKSNDYKVVTIVRVDDTLRQRELPLMFQIYTLSSNSWREIDVVIPIHIRFGVARSAYKNGINHWIAFEPQGWVIVSFDFGDEVLRTKRGPDVDCCGLFRHAFTLLNGSLALILYKDEGQREPGMEIWVTNDDDSWTYHSTIGPVKDCLKPLAIWGDIKVFFSNRKGEWCLYDHSTRDIRIIKSYSGRRFPNVVIYDESLVSIQGVNRSEEEDTTVALDGLSNMFALEKKIDRPLVLN